MAAPFDSACSGSQPPINGWASLRSMTDSSIKVWKKLLLKSSIIPSPSHTSIGMGKSLTEPASVASRLCDAMSLS